MIVPFGTNCHTAYALRETGHRVCSYPFDWVAAELGTLVELLLRVLKMTGEEFDGFVESTYCLDTNTIFTQGWSGRRFLMSGGVQYPHDELDTIKDKYRRRWTRLREDYIRAAEVTLVVTDMHERREEDIRRLECETEDKVRIVVITTRANDVVETRRVRVVVVSLDDADESDVEGLRQKDPRTPPDQLRERAVISLACRAVFGS